ncbi:MAG: hypothetical protein DBW85_02545 [Synechococcus sp. MED-G71]|jgi:hypothetical protein|nr:MAG: hypothetical protein DBW85_02545 [Synechococcus sp. MED-G71]|tara:strand:+ start:22772 stop:23482 length:711 start_codon:yes stop_codon:yes gene_type:complete
MQDVFHRLRSLAAAASAALPLALLAAPALAIPEEQALKKLSVIPVFLLTSEKGVPLPIPQGDDKLLLPMFLQKSRAEQELGTFQKTNPDAKAKVSAIPMNVANERVNEMNEKLKADGKQIVTPVVGAKTDMDQATAILRKQGVSAEDIQKGLSVPVFFHKPFITVNSPNGVRGVFFLSYGDASRAASSIQGAKPEIQAADITNALAQIIDEKKDNFVFYPTSDFFKLMKEEGGQQN